MRAGMRRAPHHCHGRRRPNRVNTQTMLVSISSWAAEGRRAAPTDLLAITADQARRSRRNARPSSIVADPATPGRPLDERLDVEGAVSSLPPRRRLAINCFCFVDLSVAETAEVMRCAPGTVKSTLADARNRLKELLDG